jgi:hypothetical protein
MCLEHDGGLSRWKESIDTTLYEGQVIRRCQMRVSGKSCTIWPEGDEERVCLGEIIVPLESLHRLNVVN